MKDSVRLHDAWKSYLPGEKDTVGSGGMIPGKAGMYGELEAVSLESLDITPTPAAETDDFHE